MENDYEKNTEDSIDGAKAIKTSSDTSFLKKVVYVCGGVACIIVTIIIGMCIYKNNFTVESILATLLAFFSIFMSVIFYFKAEDTSNKFYDSSYKFMGEMAVTLGKIEERFGAKFNSLDEHILEIYNKNDKNKEELLLNEKDKNRIVSDMITKMNPNEQEKYKRLIQEKDEEISKLRNDQDKNEQRIACLLSQSNRDIENQRMQYNCNQRNDYYRNKLMHLRNCDKEEAMELLNSMPIRMREELMDAGVINVKGEINYEAIHNILRSM